jgi:hypothetical protein
MDMTGVRLDHEEHLYAPQGNRVAGSEEITRQHRGCLQAQEVPPGRAAALRAGGIRGRLSTRRTVDAPAR